MKVTMYTILDNVNSNPSQLTFHPATAAIYSTSIIVAAYLSPKLELSIAVFSISTAISILIIKNKQHRKTFVFIMATCIAFSLTRLTLLAFTTQSDESALNLPRISFPSWLGSLSLGGPVDTDSIISSANSMTVLTCIVLSTIAFSFLIGPSRMVHLVPKRLGSVRELTNISSNVLWRTPNELRLIDEAQSNYSKKGRFSTLRNVVPLFISELVSQTTTHAGVFDLRKNAIKTHSRWYKFTFEKDDLNLLFLCIFFLIAIYGVKKVIG